MGQWGWQQWKHGWDADRLFDLGFWGLDHHIGILGLGFSEKPWSRLGKGWLRYVEIIGFTT